MENVTTAVDHVIGTVASTLAAVPQMLAGEQSSSPAPADHDAHPLKFVALLPPFSCDNKRRNCALKNSPLEAKLVVVHDESATTEIDEQTGEDFVQWRRGFDLAGETDTITRLLAQDEALRAMHARLVPVRVPYATFWQNYFWQLHLQDVLTKKRLSILRRMQKTSSESAHPQQEGSTDASTTDADAAPAPASTGAESSTEKKAQPAESSAVGDDDDDDEMGWGSDSE